jgi:hypothetical protein
MITGNFGVAPTARTPFDPNVSFQEFSSQARRLEKQFELLKAAL